MTFKLDALNDFDKSLINNIFDHHIKNIRPIITADNKTALADDKRLISSIIEKIEANNHEFTKEELTAFYNTIGFFHSELITYQVDSYTEEPDIDHAHNLLKKMTRTIEGLFDQ